MSDLRSQLRPQSRSKRLVATAVGALLFGAVAAVASSCSSDSSGSSSGNSDSSSMKASAAKTTTIKVELKEWAFDASSKSAPAGMITFEAKNKGKEVHELVLFKTDLAPADLPVDEEGAVDEKGAGLELIDEVENVKPGETKLLALNLQPGKYVMACNVVENGQRHFMNAMYSAFTVTA